MQWILGSRKNPADEHSPTEAPLGALAEARRRVEKLRGYHDLAQVGRGSHAPRAGRWTCAWGLGTAAVRQAGVRLARQAGSAMARPPTASRTCPGVPPHPTCMPAPLR